MRRAVVIVGGVLLAEVGAVVQQADGVAALVNKLKKRRRGILIKESIA